MTLENIKGLLKEGLDRDNAAMREQLMDFFRCGVGEKLNLNGVEVELVQNDGEFHDSCEQQLVFKIEDKFYSYSWTYNSWDTPDYEYGINYIEEVIPEQTTITVYKPI